MEKFAKNAAGLDIGAKDVFVALEDGTVNSFKTFTQGFKHLARYLLDNQVQTVAMEATGVYWVVLYDVLVEADLDVWLVDGRQTKQVPGRKTDVKDCQWIQQLHSYGLLNRCYVATGAIKELRSYQRQREDHIRNSSMHIQHIQKALTEMNIRLTEVISQVHGKSGMSIIKAILDGERDRHKLLDLCDKRIKENKSDDVLKALEGYYTNEGLFKLRQAYEAYEFYKQQIQECDEQSKKMLEQISADNELPSDADLKNRKPIRHNKPEIDGLAEYMLKIFDGNDATQLSGLTDYSWLQLLSELGTDLSRWPTEKHFTSWLGLAPGQNNSGKKKKNAKKGNPKVGLIFREIAQSIINSKYLAWGSFARRLKARKGPSVAIKALARKIAEQYWRLMVKGGKFVEQGVKKYQEQLQLQKEKALTKLASELGMKVEPAKD
jgi:transposase